MSLGKFAARFTLPRVALRAAALLCCLLLAAVIAGSPPPSIQFASDAVEIDIAANKAWTLFPGDCVSLRWRLEGIHALYLDGMGKVGVGEETFCPAINATGARFELIDGKRLYRQLTLEIRHLPDLLLHLAGFVGFTGAILLALYLLWAGRLERTLPVEWLLTFALLLALAGFWLWLRPQATPHLDEDDGALALWMRAERDRTLFPHECVTVEWSLAGGQVASFNGRPWHDEDSRGHALHCADDGDSARLEIVKDEGQHLTRSLAIPALIPNPFKQPLYAWWCLFGLALAALVYIPLARRAIQALWRAQAQADALAIAGCCGVVLILYLPYGFDSSLHWEEWILRAYMEGGPLSWYRVEAVSRPWVMTPHTAAYIISAETVFGFHLVNFLMHAGMIVFAFGSLRQFGAPPLYAFLLALLFFAYPVNEALLRTRILPNTFSVMTSLLAACLFLWHARAPSRLTMLGIWLALLFSFFAYESGFALMLLLPPLLFIRERRWSRRSLNLCAIWYAAPLLKAASVVLLIASGRDFYQSGMLAGGESAQASAGPLEILLETIGIVFPATFLGGWHAAWTALSHNPWPLSTLLILALATGVAWRLSRDSQPRPDLRAVFLALVAGLSLIVAAIAVLMWLPLYRYDSWRLYQFAPLGAAIVVFCLLLLLTAPIRQPSRRNFVLVALCLLLLTPAMSRLCVQVQALRESAAAKARILHQTLEIAPALKPGVDIALFSELDNAQLAEKGVFELLHNTMLGSALRVLYHDDRLRHAYFCPASRDCSLFAGDETILDARSPDPLLQRTLVLELRDDLSVAMMEDPASRLGLAAGSHYDASALIEADAPLPRRAGTMLGWALDD